MVPNTVVHFEKSLQEAFQVLLGEKPTGDGMMSPWNTQTEKLAPGALPHPNWRLAV